jgi:ABC-type transporter Mla MlaB component
MPPAWLSLNTTEAQRLMFRITSQIHRDEVVLKLEGCLAGAWVRELDACWHATANAIPGRQVRVDLRDVCHVDEPGRELLTQMYRAGARFVSAGCVMPEVLREIAESVEAGRRS